MRKSSLAVTILLLVAVLVGVITLPEKAKATTLYVGGAGLGNFTTIQGAIDAASPGDIVYVYSGKYNETISIGKSLSLIGEDRRTTVIDGKRSGDVVQVSADWVNISGFTIRYAKVLDYKIGLRMEFASFCTISDNFVYGNYHGLFLLHSDRNVIAGNRVSANNRDGIRIAGHGSNLVINNTVFGNGVRDIHLEGSHGSIILENTVTAWAGSDAIHLEMSDRINISRNSLEGGHRGIYMRFSTHNTIRHNVIRGSEHGMHIYGGHSNRVVGNNFTEHQLAIYLASFNNSIHNNNFADNILRPYDNNGSNQWDMGYPSGGNYWDDYDGVDENSGPNQSEPGSDGIGDTPYEIPPSVAVDRYPLLGPYLSVQDLRPLCSILSPVSGETLSGSIVIAGGAHNPDGVVEIVQVRIDNQAWIGVEETTLWTYVWNTKTVSNGEHTIFARSYDGISYSEETSVVVIVDNPSHEGNPLLGEIFFWIGLAVIIVIASAGLIQEARRRRKD